MSLAKSLMYYGCIHDITTMTENIRALSAQQLREVAELVAPSRCATLTLT